MTLPPLPVAYVPPRASLSEQRPLLLASPNAEHREEQEEPDPHRSSPPSGVLRAAAVALLRALSRALVCLGSSSPA